MERRCPKSQPSSRTGENPPYGMRGEVVETSASFEARFRATTLPDRLPAGPKPTPSAGRTLRRDHDEKSELGARRRHQELLRHLGPHLADEIRRAPCRGPARLPAHPEMAEGGRAGGWRANRQWKGHGTRRVDQPAPGQPLPPPRVRPVGPALEESGERRRGRGP